MSKTSKAMKTAAVALLGAAALGGDWGKAAQTAAQDAQATENSVAFSSDFEAGPRVLPDFERASGRFGDAETCFRQGLEATFGLNGAKIDARRGLELLTCAALAGSLDAQAELAALRLDGGAGTAIDASQALAWAFEAARRDDPNALRALGKCYYYGHFVARDDEKAEEYFARALRGFEERAANGDARAKIWLASYLARGFGATSDDEAADRSAAFKLTSEAASAGLPTAIGELGFYYERGIGVEPDVDKALELYRRAADAGDVGAMRKLSHAYAYGLGVPQNLTEAIAWNRRAADLGDATAAYNLGVYYFNGVGVPRNLPEAIERFRQAADAGNAMAAYSLGACYFEGIGVWRRPFKALELFRRAAEAGDVRAARRLSEYYAAGTCVRRDATEAAKWRRRSEETISFSLPALPNERDDESAALPGYFNETEFIAPSAPAPEELF